MLIFFAIAAIHLPANLFAFLRMPFFCLLCLLADLHFASKSAKCIIHRFVVCIVAVVVVGELFEFAAVSAVWFGPSSVLLDEGKGVGSVGRSVFVSLFVSWAEGSSHRNNRRCGLARFIGKSFGTLFGAIKQVRVTTVFLNVQFVCSFVDWLKFTASVL